MYWLATCRCVISLTEDLLHGNKPTDAGAFKIWHVGVAWRRERRDEAFISETPIKRDGAFPLFTSSTSSHYCSVHFLSLPRLLASPQRVVRLAIKRHWESGDEYSSLLSDVQLMPAYVHLCTCFCAFVLNGGYIWNKTEIKLKQNNFTETKHCFAFVLFQFYFSFISDVTTSLLEDCLTGTLF